MEALAIWTGIVALVIAINAIPAFMPPTWLVLTFFYLHEDMAKWWLILIGAVGATIGRVLLAFLVRRTGSHILPKRWRENAEEMGAELEERPVVGFSVLTLSFLGPLPTNQMFIAMGLAGTPLLIPTIFFAVTRAISYAVWMTAAHGVSTSLESILAPSVGNTGYIIGQIVSFGVMVVIMEKGVPKRWRHPKPGAPSRQAD